MLGLVLHKIETAQNVRVIRVRCQTACVHAFWHVTSHTRLLAPIKAEHSTSCENQSAIASNKAFE